MTDGRGVPLGALVTAGQAHQSKSFEALIPTRSDQPQERLNRSKYRRRNVVERCIGWLKESRRVATRYEKLACHYLAMVKLAMIQRCLRLLDPSNRA